MSHCNPLVCSSSSRQSCRLPCTDGGSPFLPPSPAHHPARSLQPNPPGWNFQNQSFSHFPDHISQHLTPQGANCAKPQVSALQGRQPSGKGAYRGGVHSSGKDLPFKSCLAMAGEHPHAAVAGLRTVQSGKYLAREPMPDANFSLLHRAIGIAIGAHGLGP